MKTFYCYLHLLLLLGLAGCSGESYEKTPLDTLVLGMDTVDDYTIVLHDMKQEGSFFPDFFHKYKIITEKQGKPSSTITDWQAVDNQLFDQHINDMGMEVVSKKDGKVKKQVAPPGYSNYVGNSQYGQWQTKNDGTSFWQFYGQYMFLQSMLGLVAGPIYRNNHMNYMGSHYNSGRPYYGTGSGNTRQYGTFSSANRSANPSAFNRLSNSNSFKNRVNSRVSRSNSRYSGSSSSKRSSSRGGK